MPAVVEHVCAGSSSTTLIAKIRLGIVSVAILTGEAVDESDGDDVDIRVGAISVEYSLAIALTVVCNDLRFATGLWEGLARSTKRRSRNERRESGSQQSG